MRTFTTAIIALLLWSCKKDTTGSITTPGLASMETNLASITLASTTGSKDSFNISSNIKWSLSINPSTATWVTISATTGSNNAKIYVSANSANTSGTNKTATIVLSAVDMASVQPVSISVTQNSIASISPFILWQRPLGGTSIDLMNAVAATPDGGCIMAGSVASNNGDVVGFHGEDDFWIVKMSSAGTVEWQKPLGGTAAEQATTILTTSDGGYVVAGWTTSVDGDVSPPSHGGTWADMRIVKLSSTGGIVWQKVLGGSAGDYASSLIETADGSIIMAGYTLSNDGDVSGNHGLQDAWIIKFSSGGNIAWKKLIGGSDRDWAEAIAPTPDGGYVFAGASISNDGDVSGNHGDEDCWVVKLDSTGNMIWQKSLGGTGFDYFASMKITPDGAVIAVGSTESADGDAAGNLSGGAWAVKLSLDGNIVWQKILGDNRDGTANSVTIGLNGDYVVAGTDGADGWVIELKSDGSVVNSHTFGGSGFDYFNSVATLTDGNFVAVGNTASSDGNISGYHGGNYDGWAVKFKF